VVKNIGLFAEEFDVLMEISESGTPVYSQTRHVVGLEPGEGLLVSFPAYFPNNGNYYELRATTLLPVDEDPSNDAGDKPGQYLYPVPRTAWIDVHQRRQPHVRRGGLVPRRLLR